MFIRLFIQLLPILVITNSFAVETDSSLIYHSLGLEYAQAMKFDKSEIYLNKAINYSQDSILTANYLNDLGIVLKKQGKYKSAIDLYIKAETYMNDSELLSKIYTNQGIIKRINGDYQKALLFYDKALQYTHEKTGQDARFLSINQWPLSGWAWPSIIIFRTFRTTTPDFLEL